MVAYFSIFFIRLVQTGFLPSGNSIFLVRASLLLVETIIVIRRKQFLKKAYTCQWTTDVLASGNHFLLHFSDSYQFFSVIEISGSQFFRKDHILANVTDFLACGNHFLLFLQALANCCQQNQFVLQLEHIFPPFFHTCQWKRVFSLLETVLLYFEASSASGNYY